MRKFLKNLGSRIVSWFKNVQDHDPYYDNIVDRVDLDYRLRLRGLGGL
jgi:hypothetical protein